MCYAKPGPRCAPHSKARITRLKSKARTLLAQRQALEAEREEASLHGQNWPVKKAAQLQSIENRLKDNHNALKVAVRDYDGTKTGIQELKQRINDSTSTTEAQLLKRRLLEGGMLRGWRKNAYEKKMEGKEYSINYG